VRQAQARELRMDGRHLRSGMGVGLRGLRSRGWEQGCRSVVMWVRQTRSPVAQAQRTPFCFDSIFYLRGHDEFVNGSRVQTQA
jgi:hypothetical protein